MGEGQRQFPNHRTLIYDRCPPGSSSFTLGLFLSSSCFLLMRRRGGRSSSVSRGAGRGRPVGSFLGWGERVGVCTSPSACVGIMLPPWRHRALEHSILTGLGFQDLRQESIGEERRGGPLGDLGLEERWGGGECRDRAVKGWRGWSASSCEGGVWGEQTV